MHEIVAFPKRTEPYVVTNLTTGERAAFANITRAWCHAEQTAHHGYEIWQGVALQHFLAPDLEAVLPEPARRPIGERRSA